jgi:hypothetical protein
MFRWLLPSQHSKTEGRRDHHSQTASISDNDDNGAWNGLRIARNFKRAAVNINTNNGGNHGIQIQPSLA